MSAKFLLIALLMVGMSFAWWDASYTKKMPVTVTISTTSTDFQIAVNVTYASGMQADFDDIRFTNSSENSALLFYLQEKSDSNWAYYWVLGNWSSGGGVQMYVYYSNAAAAAGGSAIGTVFPTKTNEAGGTAGGGDNIMTDTFTDGSSVMVADDAGYTPYRFYQFGYNMQSTGTASYIKHGLYNVTVAGAPNNKLLESNWVVPALGWLTPGINTTVLANNFAPANNTNYSIMPITAVGSGTCNVYFVAGTNGDSWYKTVTANTLPATFVAPTIYSRFYNGRIIFYHRKWLATEPTVSFGSATSANCTAPAINNDWWVPFSDNCIVTTYTDIGTGTLYLTGGPGNFTLKAALQLASRSMTCGTAPCAFVMWPTLWFG